MGHLIPRQYLPGLVVRFNRLQYAIVHCIFQSTNGIYLFSLKTVTFQIYYVFLYFNLLMKWRFRTKALETV